MNFIGTLLLLLIHSTDATGDSTTHFLRNAMNLSNGGAIIENDGPVMDSTRTEAVCDTIFGSHHVAVSKVTVAGERHYTCTASGLPFPPLGFPPETKGTVTIFGEEGDTPPCHPSTDREGKTIQPT